MPENNINQIDVSNLIHSPIKTPKKGTDQNEFLQLFVAQLKNQNPLDPQDSAEFLSQLAQFSTVEGIKNLETTFNKFADSMNSTYALQASSLVGKKVQVRTDAALYLSGQSVKGTVELAQSAADLEIDIFDETGRLVRTINLGSQKAGDVGFTWDGLDNNGNAALEGIYRVAARSSDQGDNQLTTYLAANVDSVTINKNGQPVTLNVAGYGKVMMDDVKAIN